MTQTPFEMVREFHETYGLPVRTNPSLKDKQMRWSLIKEETKELKCALDVGDIVETADALADLLYVTYGAALTFGLDLDLLVAEVHRSNMTKLDENGQVLYREDGKVLKGPNFESPNLAPIIFGNSA